MSLVVKSFAAVGGEVIRDDPNRAESAAIWFYRSVATAEGGALSTALDDAGDVDASMIA